MAGDAGNTAACGAPQVDGAADGRPLGMQNCRNPHVSGVSVKKRDRWRRHVDLRAEWVVIIRGCGMGNGEMGERGKEGMRACRRGPGLVSPLGAHPPRARRVTLHSCIGDKLSSAITGFFVRCLVQE